MGRACCWDLRLFEEYRSAVRRHGIDSVVAPMNTQRALALSMSFLIGRDGAVAVMTTTWLLEAWK